MELALIPRDTAYLLLPEVEKYIRSAALHTYDQTSPDSVIESVMNGTLALWVILEGSTSVGCVVTGFIDYATGRALDIVALGCDAPREEWLPLFQVIEEYAQENNAQHIEFTGRMGWLKVMAKAGFDPAEVKMTLKVGT